MMHRAGLVIGNPAGRFKLSSDDDTSKTWINNGYILGIAMLVIFAVVGILGVSLGTTLVSLSATKNFVVVRPPRQEQVIHYWEYPWVTISGIGFWIAAIFYLVEVICLYPVRGKEESNPERGKMLRDWIQNRHNIFTWLKIAAINAFINTNWLILVGQGDLGQLLMMAALSIANAMYGWNQEINDSKVPITKEIRGLQESSGGRMLATSPKSLVEPGSAYLKAPFWSFLATWVVIFFIRTIFFSYNAVTEALPWNVIFVYVWMVLYDLGLALFLGLTSWRVGPFDNFSRATFIINIFTLAQVGTFFFMCGPSYFFGV